jgi:hypothetical protein
VGGHEQLVEFASIDRNHDGVVSAHELETYRKAKAHVAQGVPSTLAANMPSIDESQLNNTARPVRTQPAIAARARLTRRHCCTCTPLHAHPHPSPSTSHLHPHPHAHTHPRSSPLPLTCRRVRVTSRSTRRATRRRCA